MFREAVARHPERDALVLGDERISYRALDATVEAVAGNLTQRGYAKGDRLALLLGNCFEFVYAVLACARTGIIVVPMSIRQRKPETEFILSQCEAAGLIYQGDLAEHLPDRAALPHLRECFVVGDGPGTPFARADGSGDGAGRDHRRGGHLFAALHLGHHRPPERRDAHAPRHGAFAHALRAGHGVARR